MKKNVLIFSIAIFMFALSVQIFAEDSNQFTVNDQVKLKFTVGSNVYYNQDEIKNLDVSPVTKNDRVMMPFRVLFEELGYNVVWNEKMQKVNASDGTNSFELTLASKTAMVNGESKVLEVAPYTYRSRLMVPLRFVVENSKANVEWNARTNTALVTKSKASDTGKLMFYNQTGESRDTRRIYVYDGTEIISRSLVGKEVKNSFSFKGAVLLTVFDSINDGYNLMTYQNKNFEVLLKNFEIIDTQVFNDNLIINGYDRTKKMYNLYRFDGAKVYKIHDDFTIGKFFDHIEWRCYILIFLALGTTCGYS